MALTAGIVGLPNVGKSTLFNAITKSSVEAANYPFATIDKNVGVVEVKDERIARICQYVVPKKTVYTTFEFTDIAGLVKGASKGEGLGNQFLANIREVDAIVHVVRCFENKDITHVEDRIDPIGDIEIINIELQLADLQTIENRLSRLERKVKMNDKASIFEHDLLKQCQEVLEKNEPISSLSFSKEAQKVLDTYHFLTQKPTILVANIDEKWIQDPSKSNYYQQVELYAKQQGHLLIAISAQMEQELASLEDEEKVLFLEELGLKTSGLDQIVQASYDILGLQTFFTAGVTEVRAWTFHKNMKAPQCAGIIHSDFERGFIKAQVYHFDDLMQYKSELAIKEAGKMRMEGKEYVVKDGDVILFRFNV